MFENKKETILEKGLFFIGKYEYEIYIWHLLIANNLYAKSNLVQKIASEGYWEFTIIMMVLSIYIGWIFSKISKCLKIVI